MTIERRASTDPDPIGAHVDATSRAPHDLEQLAPSCDEAARAYDAIQRGYIERAKKHAASASSDRPADHAWLRFIDGLICIAEGRMRAAQPLLIEAAAFGMAAAPSSTGEPESCMIRLSAEAMHHLGRVHRRAESTDLAKRAHLSSYRLRQQFGTLQEQWASMIELGLDHEVAQDDIVAGQWYEKAVNQAKLVNESPHEKQAQAWTHLTACRSRRGLLQESVQAARSAHQCWIRHDAGGSAAAQAEGQVGASLLEWAESLTEQQPDCSRDLLDESVTRLACAAESLLAFGPSFATEARSLLDQQDIATRIRASLER